MPARDKRVDVLNQLIEFRKEIAKSTGSIVIEEKCGDIGLCKKYKHSGKEVSGRFYLINEQKDGVSVNMIYDNNGRSIAKQVIGTDGQLSIKIDDDVEINEELLANQIKLGEEKIREENNIRINNNGEQNGGEGRDKAVKEHENIEQPKSKQNNEQQNTDTNQVVNLTEYDISVDTRFKTRLNQIINGYKLWDILNIEEKLKGRVPKGMDERIFRNGYLKFIDSSELESKDGKKREKEKTLAITTADGSCVIELDDEIVKPQASRGRLPQERAERDTLNFRDGREEKNPENYLETTEIAYFEIPDVKSRFNVEEKWYISVDYNRDFKLNGKQPMNGNREELSFVQQSSEQSQEDYYLGRNMIKNKLEDCDEPLMTSEEDKHKQSLKEYGQNEALETARNYFEQIVDKCFKENENLRRYL